MKTPFLGICILMIIFLWSCKKESTKVIFKPSEAKFSIVAAHEIDMDFYTYPGTSNAAKSQIVFDKIDSNFYLVLTHDGSYLPLQIKFKMKYNVLIKKVQWEIGSGTYIGDSVYIDFNNPIGEIDVKAIVTYIKQIDNFNSIEVKDTISKKVNFIPLVNFGFTFKGITTDQPQDTFSIKINYDADPNWSGNTSEHFYNIAGLPKGYLYKIPGAVNGDGIVFQAGGGYPPPYSLLNSTYYIPPFGTAIFKNSFDSIEVKFSYATTPKYGYWGDSSKVFNKVFIGKRVL